MTEATAPAAGRAAPAAGAVAERPIPPRGWVVIAGKEFGDHLTSARFAILLIVLGLAAGIPLYLASDVIRQAASQVSEARALFLAMFTLSLSDQSFLGLSLDVQSFVALAAPLLGIAFAFDAVNSERSDGTLPRLVSQPIYRDDVINGKFAAALAVISLTLVFVVLVIAGFGMLRLGIFPTFGEIVRLAMWVVITIAYVGIWLAFATLLSVVFNRAATSALASLGTWLLLVVFGSFLVSLLLRFLLPVDPGSTASQQLATAQFQVFILRLLPTTLYAEASTVLLDPSAVATATLANLGQYEQASQQIPTLLSLDQSLLLVWPHIVTMIAMMAILFAAAYIRFMRQEVRA
jgi:ABC-2 type transport system permease protein